MLLIDRRTGSVDLSEPLKRLGVACEVVTLPFGDVALVGRGEDERPTTVGVEVKTVGDLLNSMTTGRLSGHQLPGLLASYDWVWVLVEGLHRPDPANGLLLTLRGGHWLPVELGSRHYLYREMALYLLSLVIRGGVHVQHTQSRVETVRWLASLDSWWAKPWSEHRGHLALYHKTGVWPHTFVPPSLVRRIAAELPGVGWERSGAVSDHFKSVLEMVRASETDWQEIDGIGKTLAKRIVSALEG